jgi:hypothetical protein
MGFTLIFMKQEVIRCNAISKYLLVREGVEISGCVKYADFFCGGLDLGFILV